MADFFANTRIDGPVNVINLHGYLDAHTASQLESIFNTCIEENRYKIVVDFSELKYISSAGLGVFMAYIETMRENGGDIKLSAMQANVFNIFDLLGFPLLYEIYDTVEEALKKFKNINEAAS